MYLKAIVVVVASVVVPSLADQLPLYHEPPQYPSAPSYHPPAPSYKPIEEYPDVPPQYKYNYGVSDGYAGANFGHAETRDGYKTEGSYTVDLPDGRKQTVTYVDNGDGLEAVVTYEGEAQYPEHPQPSYPAPLPAEPAYVPVEPSYPDPPPPPPAYIA